ncbi:phenylcoumaran benzylic ether reductase Betv6-like [Quercus lobata]|uniref:phenylcoumaran benzylic ether reductase Betv6-like n=1 Tax=Quercus lobata TaxID=97700 RepID=UPI001244F45E|nr:phenylcoumaran benzylic ether reductase Betv6-like [Quercus lobata]
MAHKSKILIIGGTGYIGKYIVEESAKAGHPTFALVRENTASNPEKSKLIESFKSSGVTFLNGDIYHHESLVKAIKQVDVVISAVGTQQIADQVNNIAAIKEAGNIKRFLPSEFGSAMDRAKAVDPIKHHLGVKASIRRSIEAEGIPYTYLLSNGFAGYFLPNFGISRTGGTGSFTAPPRDKVEIIESPSPLNLRLSIKHATFVRGNLTNSEVKTSFGVEASELYPEVKYTTADEYLDQFV